MYSLNDEKQKSNFNSHYELFLSYKLINNLVMLIFVEVRKRSTFYWFIYAYLHIDFKIQDFYSSHT